MHNIKMEQFFGVAVPTVGIYLLYKIKLLEMWLLHNPELCAEVYLKGRDFIYSMLVYTFINELHC